MSDTIPNLPERIFLCGFMGAGKSTIGKALACRLERAFCDLDEVIEEAAGQTIPEIFDQQGEKAFRRLEREQLLKLIQDFHGVVALGGGTLQHQHLIDHIKLNGLLIFIQTPISVILPRIMAQTHRPLLLDENGMMKPEDILKQELRERYEERLPRYEQAEIHFDTTKYDSLELLITSLIKKIKYHVALH